MCVYIEVYRDICGSESESFFLERESESGGEGRRGERGGRKQRRFILRRMTDSLGSPSTTRLRSQPLD